MPRAKSEEEKNATPADAAAAPATKTRKKASGESAATTRKSPAAVKRSKTEVKAGDADEEATPKRRPATPAGARPSIYDTITASAKKAEADRAAKLAAHKASISQSTPGKPATPAGTALKRPSSPFLNAPITRAPSGSPTKATGESPRTDADSLKPSGKTTPTGVGPAGIVTPSTAGATTDTEALPQTPPSPTAISTAPEAHAQSATAEPLVEEKKDEAAAQSSTTNAGGAPATTKSRTATRTAATPAQSAPGTVVAPKPGATTAASTAARPSAPPTTPAAPTAQPEARPPSKIFIPPGRTLPRPVVKPAETVTPKPTPVAPPVPTGPIALPSVLTVRDLAVVLNVPIGEMIKRLMAMKIFATVNQAVDYDTATLIAEEFGLKTRPADAPVSRTDVKSSSLRTQVAAGEQNNARLRPPVVTVLGHVDHGKTSLLDAIRHAKVAAGEAGGITQHIGAYQIERNGRKITFLDTPGHEAFTAMRARGAQVTDVAILVVAADDGVMPQTREAINHVRAANVPMVVAMNKIDRETADPARVMRQLADSNVLVEEWGGDTPLVPVSAKTHQGIDELLEMILLMTDLAELKANPDSPAVGTVIEAQVDRSRGPVATLLVQNGTLRQNDYIVVEHVFGRMRAMFDDKGNRLNEAGPATPVLVLGMPSAPPAGSVFRVAPDERTARQRAEEAASAPAQSSRATKTLSLDEMYAQMEAGKMYDLNIVLKADVQGSLEPIRNSIAKLSTDNLKVRLLHEGLGNISESDVSLALASQAIVIGFHVDADPAARKLANSEGVDIRLYDIIYELIDDVDKALKGLLEPTFKEVVSGKAEVRQVFRVSKRIVAGSYVTEGKALRSGNARVLRNGKTIFDGRIASLKRFTEDVREVNTGYECGVMLEGFEDLQVSDVIEFYHKEKEE